MNIIITYGIYMVISGSLAILSTAFVNFLNWQSTSSFLNIFSGLGAGMFAVGFMAIICDGYLKMISKTTPQKSPLSSFLGSLLGAIVSIGVGLYSIYLEQPVVVSNELFIVGFRFISIFGLFASPSCLIKGYLRKTRISREEHINESNI